MWSILDPAGEPLGALEVILQFTDIAAGDGDGIVGVTHQELHGAGIGGDLLHLTEIDHEGAVATDYHGIGLQRILHLFHRGAEHICMNLTIVLVHDLDVVTNGLYV